MRIRHIITFIIVLLVGCSGNCLAQGQISRPGKQTTAPAKTTKPKPQSKPQSKPQPKQQAQPQPKQQAQPQPKQQAQPQSTSQPKPLPAAQPAAKLHYNTPDGYYSNHGYVDLGLPSRTKWATCNIGANTPVNYGTYFAWGETAPKSTYTGANSLYALKRPAGLLTNNKDLAPAHDAAHVNWGGPWRMPTRTEIDELVKHCTWQWFDAPAGMLVTGPNGKSIFLPASGAKDGNSPVNHTSGCLWGSTVDDPIDNSNASELYFSKSSHWGCGSGRYYGFNIRPVCK